MQELLKTADHDVATDDLWSIGYNCHQFTNLSQTHLTLLTLGLLPKCFDDLPPTWKILNPVMSQSWSCDFCKENRKKKIVRGNGILTYDSMQ